MSHTMKMESQIKELAIAEAACRRLNLEPPVMGRHFLYDGSVTEGLAIKLPGWEYPVVANLATGELKYDNYNGHWGDIQRLHDFTNAYGIEVLRAEALVQGHSFEERTLDDGTIEAIVTVEW